ncbi:MAG TPA: hypothetical protein VGH38_17720, partial [Bryobacteraceae bacterium]
SLPTPDLSNAGVINLSASDGKIALVSNSTNLSGAAPSGSQIVDFIGYGSANFSEGSSAPALTNTSAAIRLSGGCTDTNNNRADFTLGAPTPRNSRSPINLCSPLPAQPPTIDLTRGALNSASFSPGQAVAPGSLVSIFGTNFATANTTASSIPLPTSLANVSVTFNGVAAPLSGVFHDPVNGDQINAQIPWEVPATANTVQVVVTHDTTRSSGQQISIAAAAPGIFAIQLSGGQVVGAGHGQAIAYGNVDGLIAARAGAITGLTTHPARIGDPATLAILATGLGPVDSLVKSGDVPSVVTSKTLMTPAVTIGGVPARIVFSGMVGRDNTGKAFGFVGVYQINVIIAAGTPTGDAVPLVVSINGVSSRTDVTIAVQ